MSRERQREGDETWLTLQDWLKGQKAAERLAGALLNSENYSEIDPSHPLGGPDGGKDILCRKDGLLFVGAVYFPKGQQSFKKTKKKFTDDLKGVAKNNATGFVFVTNQELKLRERKELEQLNPNITVEVYHLERLNLLLNVPKNYGIRLEFLSIRITEEEHLGFLAARDEEHYRRLQEINRRLDSLLEKIEEHTKDLVGYATGGDSVAYLMPCVGQNSEIVCATLITQGKYPVFGVGGYYVDLDNWQQELTKGRNRFEPVMFSWGTIEAERGYPSALQFDMMNKDRRAINLFLNTRNKNISHEFRFFKVNREIVIAYRVMAANSRDFSRPNGPTWEVLRKEIPDTVPGYNPQNPDAIFATPDLTQAGS